MGFRATDVNPKVCRPELDAQARKHDLFWGFFLFVYFKRVARRVKLYQTEGL